MIITARRSPIRIASWKTPIREATGNGSRRENKLTFDYLGRDSGAEEDQGEADRALELREIRRPVPAKAAATSFRKNTGLQNQSVLYTATACRASAKALLDPNTLSKDGTVALSGY